MASSSSSTLGSDASALAISSRLRPGVPRLLAAALKAPKAFVTLCASSSMAGLGLNGLLSPAAREQGKQSARQEAGDDDDDGAIDDEGEAGAFAAEQAVGNLLQRHQDQGPD